MTDDIVARLRTWSADESTWDLLTEAADEIERLRMALREIEWSNDSKWQSDRARAALGEASHD
jgi:hypothetical protein